MQRPSYRPAARVALAAALTALSAVAGCGGAPSSPDEETTAAVGSASTAADAGIACGPFETPYCVRPPTPPQMGPGSCTGGCMLPH